MTIFKALLKFVVIALVFIIFIGLWVSNVDLDTIKNVNSFWSKVRWVFIVMLVGAAGFAYFSWEEIGKHLARKYDYPDAVKLFNELKNTIFISFAVILISGVVL